MKISASINIEALLVLLLPLALFVSCAASSIPTSTEVAMNYEEMRKPSIENELFLVKDDLWIR